MRLRVMTWNIHSAIGPDGRYDLDRVLSLIRRHDPDILAVQEIESRNRGDRPSPFAALRGHFAAHATAETLRAGDGAYGHMLLSRWPMEEEALHDLSYPGREPRSAISARVRTPGGYLGVIASHLGLRWRERRHQAARLAALARRLPGPLVVMGDFNDWSWRGPVWRALAPVMPAVTRHRTFPAHRPLLRLDEIFCRPAPLLGPSWRDPLAREASDHLPVVADLNPAALRSAGVAEPERQAPGPVEPAFSLSS